MFKPLNESRAAVAELVNAPVDSVVFVANATEGVNTVLRNLAWDDDCKDVVITFTTVYGACGNSVDYLVDYNKGKVSHRQIELNYPVEDEEILDKFRSAVKMVEAEGNRVKVCMFDVVSSMPGVVFPWQDMVKLCRELGVLSLVDGAQGVGMVHIDLSKADPDFFVTNCHKWLHVPKGCAVFYVPERNHRLITTTLATSAGYEPQTERGTIPTATTSKQGHFVFNFQWQGTRDYSSYLCVKDAIAWRKDVLGGEERIIEQLWSLNKKGSKRTAELLGTQVLENKKGTLSDCAMANVALPLWVEEKGEGAGGGDAVVPRAEAADAFAWMMKTAVTDYKTEMPLYVADGRFWTRLSAQVYVDMEDYEYAARTLKKLCDRVGKGDFKKA